MKRTLLMSLTVAAAATWFGCKPQEPAAVQPDAGSADQVAAVDETTSDAAGDTSDLIQVSLAVPNMV
jgi:hypothetical protein